MFHKAPRFLFVLTLLLAFLFTGVDPAVAAPPTNDNFTNAEPILTLPFNDIGDNTEATIETGEPQSCGFPVGSLWYSFTPTEDMVLRVDMDGSPVGGFTGVYLASGPTISDLVTLTCASTNAPGNFQVEAGRTYYLQVDSFFGQAGVLQVNLQQIIPPANDNFADAQTITSLPFGAAVDNTNGSTEPDEPQACSSPFRSVWYSFTPEENMAVRVDMEGSLVSGAVSIFLASGAGIADLTFLACATSNSSNFMVEAGQTYYLRVDSFPGQTGVLQINLQAIAPPANDNFVDSMQITSLPFSVSVDNTDATSEPGEPQNCNFPYRSVWYSFTPGADMVLRLDMAGSIVGGFISIYLASGPTISDLTQLACTSSGNSTNLLAQAGQTYYIRADSFFGQAGVLQVNLQQIIPPSNDSFESATAVSILPFSDTVEITNATVQPGEPQNCSFMSKSVWYAFTPSETMSIRVDTLVGSNFMNIYRSTGPAITDLQHMQCMGPDNYFTFLAEAGQTFYFQVSLFDESGSIQFDLRQAVPPANDAFVSAEVISSLPFNATPDLTDTGIEPGEPQDCGFKSHTIWYAFTPSEAMSIRAEVQSSNGFMTIYRSTGSGISDLQVLPCINFGSPTILLAEAGQTYYLQVGFVNGTTASIDINLQQVFPPANDVFSGAETVSSLPFSTTVDITNAWNEPNEPQFCLGMSKTVWYSFTATETLAVRADTLGSSIGANLNVYRQNGTGIGELNFVGCTANMGPVTFLAEAGQIYYLQVGNPFGEDGTIQINLQQGFPPANDMFANSESITTLPFSATSDLTDATTESGEFQFCFFMSKTVWYSFTPAETRLLRLNALGGSIIGNVNIYSSSGGGLADLQFLNCSGAGSSASFLAEAGQTYYLQAGSAFGEIGTVTVNLFEATPPSNDNLADAEAVSSLPFTTTVDTSDATNEPDEPQYCYSMPNTVWYSYTALETMKVRADTVGSAINANVNVYRSTGSGFPDLEFIQCANFDGATAFSAVPGETYFFQVGGVGQAGVVQFNLTEVATITGRVTDAVTGAPLPGNIEPFASVYLYRACGEDCLEFVNSQPSDENGRFSFESYYFGAPLIPGEYEIEASAQFYVNRQFGPFTFSGSSLDVGDLPINPPAVIHGRLVDAESGAPLSGASITLLRCDENGCFEFVNSLNTGEDGLFRFDSYFSGVPLIGGTYELEVSAVLYESRRLEVTIGESETRDLGDVPVTPLPLIGSISGRLVEDVTGSPISDAFLPMVDLYRCSEDFCEFVNSMAPEGDGRFRFETDFSGNRLPVGSYWIVAHADQFDQAQTEVFPVGEDMHRTVGEIRLNSFPVRFSEVQFCDEIPASGGTCDFSVRISNGTNRVLKGRVWSMADSILPGSLVNFTQFQLGDPQHLKLNPGSSITLRFRLSVPANNSPEASSICTRVLVGEDTFALFNTIGLRHVFCVLRNGSDSQIVLPQEVPVDGELTASAAVSLTEIEPNNSCQTAQDVGAIMESTLVAGALDSGETADIDFYRFTGTPGMQMAVDHEGGPTGKGTLGDPLLGFFDSNCSLIAFNDDSSSLNSHLDLTVPEDGVFILAATAFPDFAFTGGGVGSYQLTVTPLVPIGSISGIVVDAVSGAPLPGDAAPFAHVRLLRCGLFGCFDVNFQDAGSDGSFRFESDFTGSPLLSGEYMIIASADQYRFTQTDIFTVVGLEDYDAGLLALSSYPLRFSDIQACTIPSQGGLCDFTVKVTNGLATRFTGRAWSIIEGFNLGTFVGYTTFQTDTAREISLDPGKSMVLRFRFQVRGEVPDGATICATAFAGQNPGPLFNTVGLRFLFCFEKGSQGFTLMTEPDTQELLQHRLISDGMPVPSGSRPMK